MIYVVQVKGKKKDKYERNREVMEIWTYKPSPRSSSRELIASESEQGIQKYWSKYLMKNSFFPYSSTLVMKIITAFSVSKFKLKTYHVSSITIVFMANQSARTI